MGALKDYLLFLINSVCFNFLQFFINSKAELKVKTELVCGSPNDELQNTRLLILFNNRLFSMQKVKNVNAQTLKYAFLNTSVHI